VKIPDPTEQSGAVFASSLPEAAADENVNIESFGKFRLF
jgi:hypothetical protein